MVRLVLIAMMVQIGAFAQEAQSPYQVFDPALRVGRLDNGLTYYVRANEKPEKRAELRLMVNAGSVLEDEDQLGFAHFLEHMAFNGTAHFEKMALVDFLESVGMRFGADVNAFTSFDMTAYMLQLPTDDQAKLDKGFLILSDWAHQVTLDPEDIDAERGVVLEEWRSGKGAEERVMDKQLPVIFHNSRYATRLPIGDPEILKNGSPEAVKRFYRDWYRPDLIAVVAVGDFDADAIEQQIRERFSQIPARQNPRERTEFEVPVHEETLFSIESDPELTRATITVAFKHPPKHREKIEDLRRELAESMFFGMFNQRLQERSKEAPPPFLYGYAFDLSFVRSMGGFSLAALAAPDKLKEALYALMQEARRVQLHGFTQSELDRQKQDQSRALEQAWAERDKTESSAYAQAYMFHYINGGPIVGIEKRRELLSQWIEDIQLTEINHLVTQWVRNESRVITVSLPEKEGLQAPTEAALSEVFEQVAKSDLKAYQDDVSDQPLVAQKPSPGTVTNERVHQASGVTEWHLNNGVRVFVKPTDFQNDEILFQGFRDGGHSLADDVTYPSAVQATDITDESGIADFNSVQLEKMLAGKVVGVSPFISEVSEGLRGSASPQDLETAMQLMHLIFTAPRRDDAAFASLKSKWKTQVENRLAQPEARFRDRVREILSQGHMRAKPPTLETVEEIDLDRALAFYQSRFGDANGFAFVFVGNLDVPKFKDLVATYLGSLPATDKGSKFKDLGIRPPSGQVFDTVVAGTEPKSQVAMALTGPAEWSEHANDELRVAIDVLNIMLREKLREELGGVYSVFCMGSVDRIPAQDFTVRVMFSCDPNRVDELTKAALNEIDRLRNEGPSTKNMEKVTEGLRRSLETNLKENRYWLSGITRCIRHAISLESLNQRAAWIETVDAAMVKRAAETYLTRDNQVIVVMRPESSDSNPAHEL